MALKRRPGTEADAVPAELSPPSELYAGYPLIAEFLSCVKYEDGTVRLPGSIRQENIRTCYRVTLYDVDSGHRLPISGSTIEQCMKELERLLGVEDAPWEVDQYLSKQVAARPKSKKKK